MPGTHNTSPTSALATRAARNRVRAEVTEQADALLDDIQRGNANPAGEARLGGAVHLASEILSLPVP